MQRKQSNADTARSPCDKSTKVQALIEYIESLRQSLSPDVTYNLTTSHSLDESGSKKLTKTTDSFGKVYQVLQNLKFEFNPDTQTVNIQFRSETSALFNSQCVDINSKEFCFVFMMFLAEWTHAVMAAMQYFVPTGWCKVPFWKALKEIRNRAFDLFTYNAPRQPANGAQKQIHLCFEQFASTIQKEEKFYSDQYCEEYRQANGESTLVKKIGKIHGVLDAFEISTISMNRYRFYFDYGQNSSDIGPVSFNDQAFWYAILNFYAYFYYKARSLQEDAPSAISDNVQTTIETIRTNIISLYFAH